MRMWLRKLKYRWQNWYYGGFETRLEYMEFKRTVIELRVAYAEYLRTRSRRPAIPDQLHWLGSRVNVSHATNAESFDNWVRENNRWVNRNPYNSEAEMSRREAEMNQP